MSLIKRLDPDQVDLTVISPRSFFFYTPLLAGCSTGTVSYTSLTESVRWHLAKFTNSWGGQGTFMQAHATDVDFKNQKVTCVSSGGYHGDKNGSGPVKTVIDYDHLIVAVGAEPNTFNIKGVQQHAIMMKEVEDSLKVQRQILENLEYASALWKSGAPESQVKKALNWVVVGGGPTGVELTAELCDLVNDDVTSYFPHFKDVIKITLVEATGKVLGMFSPAISEFAKASLEKQGARVWCDTFVTGMDNAKVTLKNATNKTEFAEEYGVLVWAGGIGARPVTHQLARKIGGEQLPEKGPFRGLKVDNKFRVKGVDNVWALGDCALSGYAPTAQAAFQQGNYLGRMFRVTNMQPDAVENYEEFKFLNYGSLAYVGSSQGVADLKVRMWDGVAERKDQPKKDGDDSTLIFGTGAFAIWRSLYFSKVLSARNRFQVAFDWTNRAMFGREISTPFNQAELENLNQP